MSQTTHRVAAAATVAKARQRGAEKGPRDPVRTIADRMSLDLAEVMMIGIAELQDLSVPPETCARVFIGLTASAVSSYLMSVVGRSEVVACQLLPILMADVERRTLELIATARTEGISLDTYPESSGGRA